MYQKVLQNWKHSPQSNPIFPLTFVSCGLFLNYECVPKATSIIQNRRSDLMSCPGTEAQENSAVHNIVTYQK